MKNEPQEILHPVTPAGIKKGVIITALAGLAAILLYATLPYEDAANKGLALLFFVAVLWFTEAVHITTTALMIPLLGVAIGIPGLTTQIAFTTFADPIIFIFFGGFALATALNIQKLDKKIAMWIISLSGSNLAIATFAIFGVTAFLSMWISNTATAAMMLPLALGMLAHLDKEKDRSTFVFILLGIAYSASIGGLGTLVGSPPNAIAARALDLDFAGWMKIGLPVMLIFMPLMLSAMYLVLRPNLNRKITLDIEDIPWTTPRVLTLVVFVSTALAWIFSSKLGPMFAISSPDTWIAMTAAVLVMLLGLSTWKQISENTDWGVLYLFGGGITLSAMLQTSGASLVLGQQVAETFGAAAPLVIIFVVAVFINILTEFTSNTASAALLVPVFATIAVEMGMPKEVLVLVIGIGASCAFMLPVATPPNAIVFGTGLIRQREMITVGGVLNVIGIVMITILGYLLM